ncbi:MAG: BatA and WFA domain-containing protein [Vicinamibacterales bacterium]
MSFLAPIFLLGLAALAVPVLIHLTQRERKTVVPVPSLMFLRRIPHQAVKRRRVRDLPLLLLRLLALLLIVAAFARPFFREDGLVAAGGTARDVMILLDRSYSMGFDGQWARAQAAAREQVEGLAAGDRASVILFDTGAEVAVAASSDRARLLDAIGRASPSPAATRYGPALKLAGSLLAESALPRREVVLVSDFQRTGWEPDEGLRLPAGTTVTPVRIEGGEGGSLALAPLALAREAFSGQERVTITAGVLNRGTAEAPAVPLTLVLGAREAQRLDASVAPGGSASVTFQPLVVPAPNTRVTVRVSGDALEADNAFRAVLTPPAPVEVIIADTGRGTRGSEVYLTRALDIGDAPHFAVRRLGADALAREGPGRARLVILDDVAVSPALAAQLAPFVERGGGLLVVAGPRASWPAGAPLSLPAALEGIVDRSRGAAATLTGLEYGHAVFEPFRAPRSGNFTAAQFYSYRTLAPRADADVLARFDDGAPALVGAAAGAGRVLVWASTLDLGWNDLALRPVFLPFVHQAARFLADVRERPAWRTLGDMLDVGAWPGPPRDRLAIAPSGAQIRLPAGASQTLALEEPGFYEIRDQQDAAATEPVVVAVNVELAESDPATVEPAEVVTAVTGASGPTPDAVQPAAGGVRTDDLQERTQRIWWYLLFTGILLLIGESLLARRLSRRTP